MNQIGLKILTFLTAGSVLGGTWLAILYTEESRRIAQAEADQTTELQRLQDTDQARREYFQNLETQRAEQRASMDAAKKQYEELLQSQPEQIKSAQHTTQQVINKPVTKTETIQVPSVSKPSSSRSTKTS